MKRQVPDYLPIRTIVKFYANHDPRNRNKLFSRTLGKILFVDNDWLEQNRNAPLPADSEFWLVDIVHETCAGEAQGCFLAQPLRRVDESTLTPLPPGMYREERHRGLLIMEPEIGGNNWLVTLRQKTSINNYAVVIRQ